jgi:hypothetical protein
LKPYLEKKPITKNGLEEWHKWCLPSNQEALSSNPSTSKKKKKMTCLGQWQTKCLTQFQGKEVTDKAQKAKGCIVGSGDLKDR